MRGKPRSTLGGDNRTTLGTLINEPESADAVSTCKNAIDLWNSDEEDNDLRSDFLISQIPSPLESSQGIARKMLPISQHRELDAMRHLIGLLSAG